MRNISHAFVAEMMSSPLQTAFLLIAVIGAVGDDNVVNEVHTHDVASPFDALRQLVILAAWHQIAAGMIMYCGQYGGIVEQTFAHDDAHIGRCFGDTAVADAHLADKTALLIHQQNMEFFDIKVLHQRVHEVVNSRCRAELWALFAQGLPPAAAQFAGCNNGYCLGGPHTVVADEVGNLLFSECVEVVVAVA